MRQLVSSRNTAPNFNFKQRVLQSFIPNSWSPLPSRMSQEPPTQLDHFWVRCCYTCSHFCCIFLQESITNWPSIFKPYSVFQQDILINYTVCQPAPSYTHASTCTFCLTKTTVHWVVKGITEENISCLQVQSQDSKRIQCVNTELEKFVVNSSFPIHIS